MGIISGFKKLFSLFNRRQKTNTLIMLGLIVLGGIAETVGIGIILPFTTILLDPDAAASFPILQNIMQIPWIGGHRRFIVFMCVGLVLVFVLKSIYMFILIYVQNRFTFNRQIDLSKSLFKSYLGKPYEYFFNKNTAELQRNVNRLVEQIVQGVVIMGLQALTEGIIVFFILILLLIVDPISTLSIALILGSVSAIYYMVLRKKVDASAKRQNYYSAGMIKTVNEGLGSIKDTRILGRENSFLAQYEKFGMGFAKASAFHNLVYLSPRLLIETLAVSGLVIIVVINSMSNPEIAASVPAIALFGMAAMRIMPSLYRILGFITAIRFNMTHLNEIFEDLRQAVSSEDLEQEEADKVVLTKSIEIKDMTFKYPGKEKDVLKNVRMTIKKGQTIGIVGMSGAGKTTLIDILLGLLEPDEGEVLIDGKSIYGNIRGFRKCVGYVPQDIFIVDDTVAANIAFGVPEDEADTNRIWESLEIANLKEYISSLEEGLVTNVGENGMRLSGGQKQRLGIARALYHNPEILVFDEATSSLDNESEKIISEAITSIGQTKTMIIIAHRLNTLEKCDIIYEIKDGSIITRV